MYIRCGTGVEVGYVKRGASINMPDYHTEAWAGPSGIPTIVEVLRITKEVNLGTLTDEFIAAGMSAFGWDVSEARNKSWVESRTEDGAEIFYIHLSEDVNSSAVQTIVNNHTGTTIA